MSGLVVTVRLELPDGLAALAARAVAALEALAAETERRHVAAQEADDAWMRRHGLGDLLADPLVAEGVAPRCQPSARREREEGEMPPAQPSEVPAPDVPLAAGESPALPLEVWTPERVALLRRDWPAGVPVDALETALNALPGQRVKRDRIAIKAAYLGVKRPKAAPVPAVPVAQSAPLAAAPVPPAPAPTPAIGPFGMDEHGFERVPYATAYAWAGQRGLASVTHGMELAAVNRKRQELGLPPFRIVKPVRAA